MRVFIRIFLNLFRRKYIIFESDIHLLGLY